MQRTRTYECMCLLDNREVRKGWQPAKDTVTAVFQKHGAEVLSARRWDERRLSFPIKGQQRATYLLAYLKADTQQIAGIRRDLQFSETVLRGAVLTCDEVPQSAYEPEAEFDVNAIPVDDSPVQSWVEQAAEDAEAEAKAEAEAEARAEAEAKAKADAGGDGGDDTNEATADDGAETKEDDR
ncbi:MAG: 30S ribosomal protein S6 [Planctomycetota bacterium]